MLSIQKIHVVSSDIIFLTGFLYDIIIFTLSLHKNISKWMFENMSRSEGWHMCWWWDDKDAVKP